MNLPDQQFIFALVGLARALYAESIQPGKQSAPPRRNTECITTTVSPWELMLGATIHITLSPRQMFALLGIPQIRPQLVMSLIMHARTPEDNH